MADILIKGVEEDLLKQDLTVMSIHPDGRVLYTPLKGESKGKMRLTKMIILPEHGELIDRGLLKAVSYEIMRFPDDEANKMYLELIDNAPTIVEANNGHIN